MTGLPAAYPYVHHILTHTKTKHLQTQNTHMGIGSGFGYVLDV